MARKPNYDYEKRRKEIDRKKKQEEKRQRKREGADRQADGTTDDPMAQPVADGSDDESTAASQD